MATPAAILSILVKADGIDRASRQIRGFDSDLSKTDKTGSKTISTFKKVGSVVGGIVAFETLRRGVGAAVSEFEEATKVGAQTNAVIKSTGGIAGVSAKHIERLSGSISKKAGIDDEAIQSGANLLLTFKNIRNETGKGRDIFDQATQAAVDLSAAGFGSLSSTSKQLGKALNDPVKGMTALGRSGVTFSEDQKKAIEALMETGKASDRVKAQQIVLREVQSQVGGSAAAQATAMDKLKVTLGNVAEIAGGILVPAFNKVATFAVDVINKMIEGKGAAGGFAQVVTSVWKTVQSAVSSAISFVTGLFQKHRDDYAKVGEAAGNIGKAIAFVWENVVWPVIKRILPAIVQIIRGAFTVISGVVKTLSALLTGDFGRAWDGVKQIFRGAAEVILGIVRGITAPFREAISRIGQAAINVLDNAWDKVKENVRNLFTFFRDAGDTIIDRFVAGIKAAPGKLVDAAKWLKDKIVGAIKKFLGIDSPSKVFMEIGGHMISGLIKGMDTGDVIKFIKSSFGGVASLASKLFGGVVGGGAGIGGATSGTMKMAQTIANKFGLRVTSGYRSPQHNAAVGGVPNSLHTHGSPGNPGAIDLVGPVGAMNAALIWARQNLNLAESMVHDAGSGLHLHLGFFKKGGFARGLAVVGEGGPEIVDFGSRGAQVYSNPQSQAMMAGGPFVNIEHMSVHSGFEARAFAADLAWRVQTA